MYAGTFAAVPLSIGLIRREVVEAALELGLPEPVSSDVALAVSEAATNAVLHAYRQDPDGTIEVTADRREDGGVEIVVADRGRGMAPRRDSPGLGMGLAIIAEVACRFTVDAEDGGTRISMVFTPGEGGARD